MKSETLNALCRYIEAHADEKLTLARLAARVHLSPAHLQRRFKAQLGVSPREFQSSCRERRFRQALRAEPSITDAIYSSGFGSSSRAYEGPATHLGMTPAQYRAGGRGITLAYAGRKTALGDLLLAASDRGLCFVQFDENEAALLQRLRTEYPRATLEPMKSAQAPLFEGWMQALAEHLAGRAPLAELPLDVHGTAFQIQVWRFLQSIPPGALVSYAEVAQAIGRPRAVRAVASACACNRVALLIPCHRVIRGDGGLGGYRWGLERKRSLIDAERAQH